MVRREEEDRSMITRMIEEEREREEREKREREDRSMRGELVLSIVLVGARACSNAME